jgi:hypothetical protein
MAALMVPTRGRPTSSSRVESVLRAILGRANRLQELETIDEWIRDVEPRDGRRGRVEFRLVTGRSTRRG